MIFCVLFLSSSCAHADRLLIAAASDLKFAMDEMLEVFSNQYPYAEVKVSYGSSGKFRTQIQNGAPYDLFFSADIIYPQQLLQKGLAASKVITYAKGRLVLLSYKWDMKNSNLSTLLESKFERFAIASPKHAPYGIRAKQASEREGLWPTVKHKLVFGDSVSHAAQFIVNRHVDAGIVALSLVMNPSSKNNASYSLVSEILHQPLLQGFIVTAHARKNHLAWQFVDFMETPAVCSILKNYGFEIPDIERH
jgi:molybdenum ABC transporter molybdate-binding protein